MIADKFPRDGQRRRERTALLCVFPAFLVLFVVALWPLLDVLYLSFTDKELFSEGAISFVGLKNFLQIFNDPLFFSSLKNTLFFVMISVCLEMVLGIIFACLMHYQHPARLFVRAIVLIPWAIPTMITTKIWEWMLTDVGGVINHVALGLGFINEPMLLTAHPTWALVVVAFIDVWKTTPFVSLIILAGLQIIPNECADAARIDGISPIRFFFKVTLPLLRNTIIVAVALRFIEAMRVFDVIYGLSGDNPATMSLSVYIRQQMFSFQSLGVASAAATVLLLTVGGSIFLLLKMRSKQVDS